jgi:hypothetical protein
MRTYVVVLVLAVLAAKAVAGGSVPDLVKWADGNCAQGQGWECAEFTARSIAAGGFIPGLSPSSPESDYYSWRGHDLAMVQPLHDYLVSIGWREVSRDPNQLQVRVVPAPPAVVVPFFFLWVDVARRRVQS